MLDFLRTRARELAALARCDGSLQDPLGGGVEDGERSDSFTQALEKELDETLHGQGASEHSAPAASSERPSGASDALPAGAVVSSPGTASGLAATAAAPAANFSQASMDFDEQIGQAAAQRGPDADVGDFGFEEEAWSAPHSQPGAAPGTPEAKRRRILRKMPSAPQTPLPAESLRPGDAPAGAASASSSAAPVAPAHAPSASASSGQPFAGGASGSNEPAGSVGVQAEGVALAAQPAAGREASRSSSAADNNGADDDVAALNGLCGLKGIRVSAR